MKTSIKRRYMTLFCLLTLLLSGCSSREDADLTLGGNTRIEAIQISGYAGEIDHTARKIAVSLPVDIDLADLHVDAITLSDGATCNYPAGMRFDGTFPRAIRVTNGDVYSDYTMTTRHDHVEFLSFTLGGKYSGTIDNDVCRILVYVPLEEDVTALGVAYEVNDGTIVDPVAGSVLDFTDPVEFKCVNKTAEVTYTVTVIKDDMSQAPKAFVGNASSVDQLGDEARAACQWMLNNVPNTRYISLQQILDGDVRLDDYKMIWCHFDWLDWPGICWDTRDQINGYWLRGGAILASRDGARYINDVWRIARDQQSPNNMFGGETTETLTDDLGFMIYDNPSHPLFDGIPTNGNQILLRSAGCSSTGRTLQWGVDWDPYGSLSGWEAATGAKALGSDHDGDPNRVTIAEFEPYEALKGYQSGRVVTIGTPSYEWYDRNGAPNPYYENMVRLTKNAINYLCQ